MIDFITIRPVKENIDIEKLEKIRCMDSDELFYKQPLLWRICSVAFAQQLPCVLGNEVYIVEGDKVCMYLNTR